MIDREKIDRMGIAVDYGDFIVIRPHRDYRINSNVIVLKGETPVIIDTGTPPEPGIRAIRSIIERIWPDGISSGYLIITHSHQDHCFNMPAIRRSFPGIKTVCHIRDARKIMFPARIPRSWLLALKNLGKNRTVLAFYGILSIPVFMLFYRTVSVFGKIDFTVDGETHLKTAGGLNLKIIPTPGHSAGHIAILDSKGNLYLGDFVPFTPWINPLGEALEDMLNSIDKIVKLGGVRRAVRSHGDIRRSPFYKGKRNDNGPWYSSDATWEVANWEEERARFLYWKEKIMESLEVIPKLLKNRILDAYSITSFLIPNFHRYSSLMKLFFIPPSITWTLAYCLKLEKEGLIKRINKFGVTYWTA